ncbi:hypothetical protein [Acidiferrobacter sp.]
MTEIFDSFCGPRIPTGLRIRRIVEEQNRRDEARRAGWLWGWCGWWQAEKDEAGGCPRPTDPAVRTAAARDLFIDEMRSKHGFCQNWLRGDEYEDA